MKSKKIYIYHLWVLSAGKRWKRTIFHKMVILRNRSPQFIQTVISLALLPVEERSPPHNFPNRCKLLADLISCTFVKARALNITGSFMKIGEVIGTAFEITSPPHQPLTGPHQSSNFSRPGNGGCLHTPLPGISLFASGVGN